VDALDPIEPLIDHAAGTPAEAVPAPVIAFQTRRLLDHLACLIAGRDAPGLDAVRQLARRWSGVEEATVFATGERLSLPAAAMVNAVAARALDYCDVISPGWHPSSSDWPVALAAGEAAGASGRDILAALALGQDVAQRINRAAQAYGFLYRGFDSNVLGLLSGAIVAGRLLGLPRDRLRDAVGLAFDHGVGTFQHYQDRALAVRLCQGQVARAAVEAALMARAGITGPRRILAGENGFFRCYAPGKPDTASLTDGLGRNYLGEEATCFKLYPSCGVTLALTDAILAAQAEGALRPGEVEGASLRISPTMRMICGGPYCPGETAPEVDAQFSVRYVAASALLRGRATLAEFTAEAALDPAARRLADRIEVSEEPAFRHFDECAIRIATPNGPVERSAKFGRGWPQNPATPGDLEAKLAQCVAFSRSHHLRVRDLASLAARLDELPDIRPLLRSLAP